MVKYTTRTSRRPPQLGAGPETSRASAGKFGAGLLKVRKKGRRHHYFVNVEAQFPDPLLSHMTMGDVVKAIRP